MHDPNHGGAPDQGRAIADHPSRRQVLRWLSAAGASSVVPFGLAACKPGRTPKPLAGDASVRGLGFVGGVDAQLGQGAWCWFQAPRASMGPRGVLWMGASVANTRTAADGAVKALAYDLPRRSLVVDRTLVVAREDDHTSPSVLALGDEVQVSWALHQRVDHLDVAMTSVGGGLRSQRIRRPDALRAPGRGTSYCSVHVVDGHRWLLYRGEQFSWNLLTSPDGVSWTARGLVVAPGTAGDRPYLQAASDGARLHVVITDGNPTEYRGTSAYAGTIEADFTIRRFGGASIGRVGAGAPKPRAFTRLAVGVAGSSEARDTDMWLSDLCVVDGRPTGILVRRDPWPPGSQAVGSYRHRYYWIRQRPTGWLVEPLCLGGGEICPSQPDYAALVAQDPTEPKRVVASTNVHPVTGVPLRSDTDGRVHFELYEGFRTGEGRWSWTAITEHSMQDNLRPVIAAGGPHKALAWMRGRYWSWTDADTRIVVRPAVSAPVDPGPTTTTTTTTTEATTTTEPVTTTTTEPATTTTSTSAPSSTTTTTPPATTTSATTTSVPTLEP
jgi:hypothetical protein